MHIYICIYIYILVVFTIYLNIVSRQYHVYISLSLITIDNICIYVSPIYIYFLVVSTPLKNISQLEVGIIIPIYIMDN